MENKDLFQKAGSAGLWMPDEIVQELRQKKQEEAEREFKQMQADARKAEQQSHSSNSTASRRFVKTLEKIQFAAPGANAGLHLLFDPDKVRAAAKHAILANAEDDRRHRIVEIVQQLADKGTVRPIQQLPEDWPVRIAKLEENFPNMAELLNSLRYQFALAQNGDGYFQFPPLALNGPPGVGKTYFCSALAEAFNSEVKVLRIEQQQDGSGLTGSSQFWANTHPGQIFENLLHSRFANSIFIVDEIDKVGGDGRFDPLSGLYQLLEPESAKAFADLSYPWLKMDASRILWVATLNEIERVPMPIQSRMRVFNVAPPTPEESRGIVRRIYQQECRKRVPGIEMEPLLDSVVDRLCAVPPRRIRLALAESIGRALFHGRRHLEVDDVRELGSVKRSIGFLNSL